MRRGDRRAGPGAARSGASAWLGVALLLIGGPAAALGQATDRKLDPKTDQKVADIAEPRGFGSKTVEGVGLVVGLAGTGSEPRPSAQREKLKTEMQRNPDLDVDSVLGDPLRRYSLVVVRATITAGLAPEDELNVEVLLPADSETTSLEGGFLVGTWLHEIGIANNGGPLEGKPQVHAYGPVITGSPGDPGDVKAGRVLGGGRIKSAVPYVLLIGERHRSGAVAKQLQDLINHRFQYRDGRFKKGVATAKNDYQLVLNVPKRYHHNQLRYLQVMAQLRLKTMPELIEPRLERWGEELLDPRTAGEAALKLEAAGGNAAPVLARALTSEHPQVRFFAAEALAYLDDASGTEELARAALERTEFRAVALAALAAMDQPAGILRLRELMAQPDPVIRYGAFNALRTSDPGDPYLGRVRVLGLIEERRRGDLDDAMAFRVDGDEPSPRREPLREDPFELYAVRADGPPLIHVSRSRRREIVLFGDHHELLTPVVLGGTGPILLNAAADDRRIELSRIDLTGSLPQVMTSSTDLIEVIRCLTALGATYPQVVAILDGAGAQANLLAEIEVDAVPSDVEKYDRALLTGEDVTRDDAVSPASFEEGESGQRRPFGLFKRFRPREAGDEVVPPARADEEVRGASLDEILDGAPARRSGVLPRLLPRRGGSGSR